MGSGQLILAMNTSPLDIFLLKYLASPVFAEAAVDGAGNQAFFRKSNRSLWGVLSDPLALAIREKESQFKGESLEKLVAEAAKGVWGPVVLFFEVWVLGEKGGFIGVFRGQERMEQGCWKWRRWLWRKSRNLA